VAQGWGVIDCFYHAHPVFQYMGNIYLFDRTILPAHPESSYVLATANPDNPAALLGALVGYSIAHRMVRSIHSSYIGIKN